MKFSKLLKMLLGMAGLFSMGVVEDGGGNTAPLDSFAAADAFSSLMGDDGPAENESPEDDTPEAAAERLAKQELSGTEEAPENGEGEQVPAADDITVEIDGKTVKLTKAQIAENYKDGLRQADYTRKTMETAAARKTADAEIQQARTERDTYAQKLNNFAIATQSAMQEQAAVLTEELAATDPQEYLIQKHIFDKRQAQLVQAQQELGRIGQQQQQEQADAQRAYLTEQQEQLLAKLPDWKDPAKAKAEAGAIKEYLAAQGYTPQERDFTDHRAIVMAKKAMQYDALIERAGKAVKKVAALPVKVERSGNTETSKPDGRTEAMKRLERTGSIDAAANAFAQFM